MRDNQTVLLERARALARRASPPSGELLDLLFFSIGDERFAIEARFVLEHARIADLAPLPGAPTPFVGIVPWRGEPLAAIDIRHLFGGVPRGISDFPRMIVVGQAEAEFAVLVETAEEIATVPRASLSSTTHALGIGATSDARLVLDSRALLDDSRLSLDWDGD